MDRPPEDSNRTLRNPDISGVLFLKERSRRRLSQLFEGSAKKDVLNGSNKSHIRQRSLSTTLDAAPKLSKYYFELTGHVLSWFSLVGDSQEKKGMLSLLSSSGVKRISKGDDLLPADMSGGFVVFDRATDLIPRRGDVYIFSNDSLQLAEWFSVLESAFQNYQRSPLAGLNGPVQAANEKPILQGELLVRDTLDGLFLQSWTKLHVSLFDDRIELRSLHATNPLEPRRRASLFKSPVSSLTVPTVKVDMLTVNFYVGDSRVCANAFLVSDFLVSHMFAASDHREKLFWMQTMAKMLRQIVALHEHAMHVQSALSSASHYNSAKNQKKEGDDDNEDEDDDDDEDEDDNARNETQKDAKRPPQLRKESMYRYYGLKLPPANEFFSKKKESDSQGPPLPQKKGTSKKPSDALAVFYHDEKGPWLHEDFRRLIQCAITANGGKKEQVRISFGQLAKAWGDEKSDALGGILLRAKRNGIVKYEGDMLFKDYDDALMLEVNTNTEQ